MAEKVVAVFSSTQVKERGLDKFAELMGEVAELPEEQQENLSFFIQGFMAAGLGRKRQAV